MDFFETRNNFLDIKDIDSILMHGIRNAACVVSIMIPTYLRNDYLQVAIQSALDQRTDISYEIVVVDNNDDFDSTDTLNIVKQFSSDRISYYKNKKNLGMMGNWNRCLELATGNWVLILHDDDFISPLYLEKMYEQTKKSVGCIGCDHNVVDENGNVKKGGLLSSLYYMFEILFPKRNSWVQMKDFYFWHPLNIVGLLIDRQAALNIGGFDQNFYPISDYVFVMNMTERYGSILIEKKLFNYRVSCNATLNFNVMVDMVENSAKLRDCVGEKYGCKNEKYRAAYTISEENEKISGWTSRFSIKEKENLIVEFRNFNRQMNYEVEEDSFLYRIHRVLYGFYARKIRRNYK